MTKFTGPSVILFDFTVAFHSHVVPETETYSTIPSPSSPSITRSSCEKSEQFSGFVLSTTCARIKSAGTCDKFSAFTIEGEIVRMLEEISSIKWKVFPILTIEPFRMCSLTEGSEICVSEITFTFSVKA